ncbi:hypothetical protein [Methylocella sp.]|uniref:hypothetical protein n=1 Tax=Methylocella sp. TaxID=1978226 RepID=UPI003783F9AC
MRALAAGFGLLGFSLVLATAPARAEDGSEAQQRCVSSCLYHARGTSDPAYERCIAKYCAHIGEDEDKDEAQGKQK